MHYFAPRESGTREWEAEVYIEDVIRVCVVQERTCKQRAAQAWRQDPEGIHVAKRSACHRRQRTGRSRKVKDNMVKPHGRLVLVD